ncbi:MAG: phosphatase PAP2 family protein [Nitrospirae bacterium]|nr:phosphatase PAP2 family protein [Nitrospirota bacterium]
MKDIRSDMSDLNRLLISIHHPVNNLFHGSTLLAVSVSLFVVGKLFRSRISEVAKSLIFGFLVSGIASQILKNIFGRMRPKFTTDTIFIGPSLRDMYHSFPSGHTAVVFCFASVLSGYYPRFSLLFYFAAAIAGFDRIFLFQHFPSDVIAGAMLGLVSGRVVTTILSNHGSLRESYQLLRGSAPQQ